MNYSCSATSVLAVRTIVSMVSRAAEAVAILLLRMCFVVPKP